MVTVVSALALTGCATGQQYQAYTDAHKAQSAAQVARYEALAKIAEMGDTTAKVAAVISLQNSSQQQSQIAQPRSAGDQALQWASILVPGFTQAYMIGQNTKLGMRQSDNATALGTSTNNAFVGIAGKIQAPAPNMTLSGTGVLGSGSYSIGANSGTNSGNSGRIAGESIYDLTHTPTVVTQPAPVIVRPEVVAPTIVPGPVAP
jgi:hypothetical protein